MKFTKKDIKKFATEDEKKLLEAGVKIRKPTGRPTNKNKLRQYKNYLEVEMDNINTFYGGEYWEDLAIELNDALYDVKKIMELEGQGDRWPL